MARQRLMTQWALPFLALAARGQRWDGGINVAEAEFMKVVHFMKEEVDVVKEEAGRPHVEHGLCEAPRDPTQSIEVKATAGDTHLGGEDFDNRVVDFFCVDSYVEEGEEEEDGEAAVERCGIVDVGGYGVVRSMVTVEVEEKDAVAMPPWLKDNWRGCEKTVM